MLGSAWFQRGDILLTPMQCPWLAAPSIVIAAPSANVLAEAFRSLSVFSFGDEPGVYFQYEAVVWDLYRAVFGDDDVPADVPFVHSEPLPPLDAYPVTMTLPLHFAGLGMHARLQGFTISGSINNAIDCAIGLQSVGYWAGPYPAELLALPLRVGYTIWRIYAPGDDNCASFSADAVPENKTRFVAAKLFVDPPAAMNVALARLKLRDGPWADAANFADDRGVIVLKPDNGAETFPGSIGDVHADVHKPPGAPEPLDVALAYLIVNEP
jgi:hypothetical protein